MAVLLRARSTGLSKACFFVAVSGAEFLKLVEPFSEGSDEGFILLI